MWRRSGQVAYYATITSGTATEDIFLATPVPPVQVPSLGPVAIVVLGALLGATAYLRLRGADA